MHLRPRWKEKYHTHFDLPTDGPFLLRSSWARVLSIYIYIYIDLFLLIILYRLQNVMLFCTTLLRKKILVEDLCALIMAVPVN